MSTPLGDVYASLGFPTARVLSRIFHLGEKSVRVAERVAQRQEHSRLGGPKFLEMDMC